MKITQLNFVLLPLLLMTGCVTSQPPTDLTGTTWTICYKVSGNVIRNHPLTFEPEGKLLFSHPNDYTPDNDFWQQNGAAIELRVNNNYVVYSGVLKKPGMITGNAKSIQNETWAWNAFEAGKDGTPASCILPAETTADTLG